MPDDDLTRLPDSDGPKESLLISGQQFGQYLVVCLLGRGGMGEVYEVKHAVLHKTYALKVIRPEVLSRPSAVERFRREAQVMSHLEHPNIVQVDEFGETEGHTWLRMRFVQGVVLRDEAIGCSSLGDSRATSLDDLMMGKPLPEGLVIDLIRQILDGLAYAHSKGAIHRDIKPSNILLEPTPLKPNSYTPKITDFGLVHMAGEEWVQSQVQLTVARSQTHSTSPGQADSEETRLGDDSTGSGSSTGSGQAGTSTHALLGTFEFMAPEQKSGEPADARSDLYAVGLMAFRMLTGHGSPGFSLPCEIVPTLDKGWDGWIKRVLAQEVESRFQSAAEMSGSLPSNTLHPGQKAEAVGQSSGKSIKKVLWLSLAVILVAGFYLNNSSGSNPPLVEDSSGSDVMLAPPATIGVDQADELEIDPDSAGSSLTENVRTEALESSLPKEVVEAPQESVSQLVLVSGLKPKPEVQKPHVPVFRQLTVPSMPELKFAEVPAGRFFWGSESEEEERSLDEGPLTLVVVDQPFWMGRYEVTWEVWCAYLNMPMPSGMLPNQPVAGVSYREIQSFCQYVTQKLRLHNQLEVDEFLSLPSESQWEYAARAGEYGLGDCFEYELAELSKYAWYRADGMGPAGLKEVGLKAANPWGIYDLLGNAWEYTRDHYRNRLPGGTWQAVKAAGTTGQRVIKGGSSFDRWGACRPANRAVEKESIRPYIGFRLIISDVNGP